MSRIKKKDISKTFIFGIEQAARIRADKPAFIEGDKVMSWKEFNERSNALAHALLDIGVKREEKVAIALYNGNEFTEATCAAWKIAAMSVPINYRFMDDELYYVLDNSDTVAIVLDEELINIFKRLEPKLPKVRYYIVLGKNNPSGWYNYNEFIKKYPKTKPSLTWKPQSNTDIGYNMYTGGTTGYPKGISYTEENFTGSLKEALAGSIPEILKKASKGPNVGPVLKWILSRETTAKLAKRLVVNMRDNSALMQRLRGDKMKALFVSPFMHAWAWGLHLTMLKSGGTVVLPSSRSFDPEEILKIIEKREIKILVAIGDATLKPVSEKLAGSKYDISSLKMIIASGMPTSPDVKKKILQNIPDAAILDVFLSSEISHGAFTLYTSSDKEFKKVTFKITDNLKVVNPETGIPVKPGEIGEVARRTDILPEGYYKDPEKTKKLIRKINGENWLFSGDLAEVDTEGYFHFVGRGNACINTGGEKVFPQEVEDVIQKHPAVKEAGVAGVPDEKWGEAVTALVVLGEGKKATKEEIIEFCRDKISGYKRPKHVFFVDSIPKTLVGKSHYSELVKIACGLAGVKKA